MADIKTTQKEVIIYVCERSLTILTNKAEAQETQTEDKEAEMVTKSIIGEYDQQGDEKREK